VKYYLDCINFIRNFVLEIKTKTNKRNFKMYKFLLPNTMPNEVANLINTWGQISKSPYSNSFYNTNEKSWDYTPEGSFRISDHWNFTSDDNKIHCKTNVEVKPNTWTLAQYSNGVYVVIKYWDFAKEQPYHNYNFWQNFKFNQLSNAVKLQNALINNDVDFLKSELRITTKSGLNKVLKFAKNNNMAKLENGKLFVVTNEGRFSIKY